MQLDQYDKKTLLFIGTIFLLIIALAIKKPFLSLIAGLIIGNISGRYKLTKRNNHGPF